MRRRGRLARAATVPVLWLGIGCSELDQLVSPPAAEPTPPPEPTAPPGPGDGGNGAPPAPAGPGAAEGALPDNDYCRPVQSTPADQAALELAILELTNAARASGVSCGGRPYPPVAPLVMAPALRCAGRAHSQDMIDRKFFDHTNPSGEGIVERVSRAGFRARDWGENIAAGGSTASATMQQWLSSAGHCRNIMDAGYRQLGVGYRRGGNLRHYWTQVFATAR